MKKLYYLAIGLISMNAIAQTSNGNQSFNWAITPDTFYVTPALRDVEQITDLFPNEEKEHAYNNNFRRQKYVNDNAFPHGNDPIWQKDQGEQFNKAPIQNWEGINSNLGFPPDPSGAAGPNHYVQMVNSRIQIFDKSGNSLWGPNALNSILSSNNGDPIVMYDRFADRWFLSGFGSGNSLSFAVSQTADPTGAYYTWEFSMSSLPDYPKYGLWHDGYYLTANKSGADCFVLDRDAMLLGDANAQMISMTIPNLTTGAGTQTGGFHSVVPSHADFAMPAASEKMNLFYFQDDAWTGITQDEIKIWEVDVDWATTSNSSVTEIQTLATTAFDSQFNSSWNDIEQPGSAQKLDGIPGAFMYRAQFTEWGSHNTVMLNHTVDVDATNHAGIRWYELRETGGVWSIHQESTFAPDAESRWLGSISMDYQGNVGMAYAVSGPTVFPSLRYTGRYATDPLNQMTLAEENIVIGSGTQSGGNRFGDYAHLSVDPDDNATFWYTSEYVSGGNRTTRIASFKLANDFNDDVGVIALTAPVNGALSANEVVTVTLKNFGLNAANNFPVSYQIDGGTIITETYSGGAIAANTTASYTFTANGDFSIAGLYNVKAYTAMVGDQFLPNDTLLTTVNHLSPNDIGVTIINSPNSANNIGMENIDVTIENFGTVSQSNFDVAYTINGGTAVVETITTPINSGATMNYTFTVQGDFTSLGSYDIIAYSSLTGDADNSNDTTYKTVEHSNCQPQGNCSFGDGVTLFQLGTIDNTSGCSPNGYVDYTTQTTDLLVGQNHDLTVTSGWSTQYISVWIDYNDNFFFEANEMVVDGVQSNLGTTTPITIAANATLGQHLLRIKSGDNQATTQDPCMDMTYGETEDYTVNLISTADDIGIVAITSPNSSLTLGNETITVSIENFGTTNQSNFDVAYTLNGGTAVVENVTATLNAGQTMTYNFTTIADMTSIIDFDIVAYTSLVGDIDNTNDTTYKTVSHQSTDDIGVVAITSPNSSFTLANETITVSIENFGSQSHTNFDVAYSLNGGTPVVESVTATLNIGQTMTYNFTTTADMTAIGDHDIVAYTALAGDADNTNDTTAKTVIHLDDANVAEESIDAAIKIVSIEGNLYTLNVNSDVFRKSTLKVHNTLGQLVYTSVIETETFTVDLSNFAKGAYLVNIRNNKTSKIIKLVK